MVHSEHAIAHRQLRLVPHSLSLGSLVVGVMAIVLLETQAFFVAGMLIWLGSVLDVLDGVEDGRLAARLHGQPSAYRKRLTVYASDCINILFCQ